jgi:uncharacterized protein
MPRTHADEVRACSPAVCSRRVGRRDVCLRPRRFSWRTVAIVLAIVRLYGITRIEINDNPVLWFSEIAIPSGWPTSILNRNFGGTYMAYLTLEAQGEGRATEPFVHAVERNLHAWEATRTDATAPVASLRAVLASALAAGRPPAAILEELDRAMSDGLDDAAEDAWPAWEAARAFVDEQGDLVEVFKSPQVLRWIELLQAHLLELGTVGKVNSLPDIVKTVHRELFESAPEAYRIPDTAQAVAQCLITYQGSHRPQDLWHFVTPDHRRTLLWVQLRSGNNRDMSATVRRVESFIAANPPPVRIAHDWFGLAYINVVWQQRMVEGMLQAFAGSFLVVFLMMAVLFRSALWGALAMVPLSVTILFMYGLVGLVGKDYDMPIAVLSSLTLGLAVDFAIHFLARSRVVMAEGRVWRDACGVMFDEPARAITRNIIVVAVGFTPLLLAPLMPYRTVGIFMATILLVAGLSTLLLLPALLRLLERPAFCDASERGFWGRCGNRLVIALAAVLAVGVNFRQALRVGWTEISWVALTVVIVLLVLCRRAGLRGEAEAGRPLALPAGPRPGQADRGLGQAHQLCRLPFCLRGRFRPRDRRGHPRAGRNNRQPFPAQNTPRDPAAVEFSSYTMWIDRVTFLPVKAEYFDRQDRLYRRIEAVSVETIQDRPTIVRSRARILPAAGKPSPNSPASAMTSASTMRSLPNAISAARRRK